MPRPYLRVLGSFIGSYTEPDILRDSVLRTRPVPDRAESAARKLFELKTMCSFVTLRDRSEPIVAHPDCDQCQGLRSCHGFMANCALQAVSCRTAENSVFTCGSPSSGARVPVARPGLRASSRARTGPLPPRGSAPSRAGTATFAPTRYDDRAPVTWACLPPSL
jgi:hypothetical protein